MIEDVDYTASGYIQAIAPDGTVISRHRQEREAQQACFQHAKDNEDLLGDGVHDYILRSPDVRMSIRLLSVGGNPTNEDTTPPDPPAGVFNNSVTSTGFTTNWTNGPESDLQEHNVYRSSTGPSSGFSLIDTVTVPTASYSHTGLTAETQYWVYVTALDSSGNESVASSVVSSTTSAASSELWDLFGARSVPSQFSSLAWPTAPTTTSTSSASSLSALNTAAAIDGREVTLNPGSYSGTVSITGNDVHVILTGSTITGTLSISGTRVRVTGGRFNHSTVVGINTDDILLYNVNFQAQSSGIFQANGNSSIEISNSVNRLALVLVTVNNEYSARAIYQSAIGGANGSDLIIAGSDLIGINSNGWGPRINGCSRTIIVDTRIRVTSPSQTGRYHADHPSAVITGYYAARNQIEEGTWNNNPFSSTGVTPGSMTGIYFYDNNFYRNSTFGQLAFAGHDGGSISTVRAEDNTHYTLANGGVGTMQIDVSSVTDYSGSNNVRAPYTTPPAFAYGSDQ